MHIMAHYSTIRSHFSTLVSFCSFLILARPPLLICSLLHRCICPSHTVSFLASALPQLFVCSLLVNRHSFQLFYHAGRYHTNIIILAMLKWTFFRAVNYFDIIKRKVRSWGLLLEDIRVKLEGVWFDVICICIIPNAAVGRDSLFILFSLLKPREFLKIFQHFSSSDVYPRCSICSKVEKNCCSVEILFHKVHCHSFTTFIVRPEGCLWKRIYLFVS